MSRLPLLLPAVALLGACGTDDRTPTALAPSPTAMARALPGVVVTASNSSTGNALLVFPRGPDGALGTPTMVASGGTGTGTGLGNQAGLRLSSDRRFLLAVNAGSNSVSVFRTSTTGTTLVGTTASGGLLPVSVAVHGTLVYILNAGGSGNVTGFRLTRDGTLHPIAGSTRPLSGAATAPAQAGFSPDGRVLVVTERATNLIGVYRVRADGLLGDFVTAASSGMTPFGFAFDPAGRLLVSEAFGGAPDASALSSYEVGRGPSLATITASAGTTETAACWVEVTPDGRFAYVTNTASGTVSGYGIAPDGAVALLDADGVTGMTGAGPIDLAITPDGRRVYTLNGAGATLSGFVVRPNGSLERLAGVAPSVPAGSNGLVAW
ncbi:MAG: beta-propeller fold lactonase family protein [Gemmatimonadota bacterium]|nr:beta-propeller fold lactonase family protein [Gemmatimonadota bacterium]